MDSVEMDDFKEERRQSLLTPTDIPTDYFADVERKEKLSKEEDIIITENVHKTYLLGVEGVPALRGINVNIKRGEFIVILGKSGGGKTSLLNILGTIDKPTKGSVYICGNRITSKTTDAEFANIRLQKIGFVFQSFNLISSMTALENVGLPMVLNGQLSSAEIKARATQLLGRVGLKHRVGHFPSQLSGGEQQRVTVARSIANKPEILLLDEPTGDLDSKNGHIVMSLLLELNKDENMTLIMVTHDQELSKYANRVIHMMDGKILRIENIKKERNAEAKIALRQQVEADQVKTKKSADHRTELREPGKFYEFLHAAHHPQDKLGAAGKAKTTSSHQGGGLGLSLDGLTIAN